MLKPLLFTATVFLILQTSILAQDTKYAIEQPIVIGEQRFNVNVAYDTKSAWSGNTHLKVTVEITTAGQNGMLRFNLEDLNRLEFFDTRDPAPLQGVRNLLVTDPQHPYGTNFWRPGHIIGYEHTFIAALGDFLWSVHRGEAFHPNFEDGLRVQQVIGAVLRSAESRQWEGILA